MPANRKVRIILPRETLRLEKFTKITLGKKLKDHFLKPEFIPAYTALYADDGTVNVAAANQGLLAPSTPKSAKPDKPVKPAKAFHRNQDLGSLTAEIMTDVKAKINTGVEFALRDEDEAQAFCDCTAGKVPRDGLKVQAEVSLFLLDRGRTDGENKAVIYGKDAKEWVDTKLKSELQTVVHLARTRNQIYHEPHHDLTPGILLIDELFRRMVQEVNDKVEEINKQTKKSGNPEPDLTELEEFVKGLAVLGKGRDSEKYGAYIHKPGDFACPCRPDDKESRFHVDPPRIELILDGDGHITKTAIKIGGWKGGTHSSGHTAG